MRLEAVAFCAPRRERGNHRRPSWRVAGRIRIPFDHEIFDLTHTGDYFDFCLGPHFEYRCQSRPISPCSRGAGAVKVTRSAQRATGSCCNEHKNITMDPWKHPLLSLCRSLGNLGPVNQNLPIEADSKGRRPRPSLCNQILRDPQGQPPGGRGGRQRPRSSPSVAPMESPRTGAPCPPPRPWFLLNNGLRTPKTVLERGGDSNFRPEGWGVESLRGTIETDDLSQESGVRG